MPSLTSLAEAILVQARKIDGYLETNHIAYPSFDGEDTLSQLPFELQAECCALANSASELKQLVRGPETGIMDIAFSWTDAVGLRVVYHYNLAKAVPLEGSASYSQIAATSGLKESLCRRFLRLVMGNHIFAEDPVTCRVQHTASSRRLATQAGLRDAVGLQLDEIAPSASKLIESWKKHGQDTGEPSHSAFSLYNQSHDPAFAILAREPERARRFGDAMKYSTRGISWDPRHLLSAFRWSSIDQPGTQLIDIGGGHGAISTLLAQHTKNIQFVVQDLPHVVSQAALTDLSPAVRDRVKFSGHDFFTPQERCNPSSQTFGSSAVIFLLRFILHNWGDDNAIKILRNLVPAMNEHSKLLIYEFVLEDHPVADLTARFGFQLDAIMATFFNAQERTATEFKKLLEQADHRYIVLGVRRPNDSIMSVIEVGWRG